MVAFGFGLIHGFGLASGLMEGGLRHETLGLALVSFNVGVELGQLAIVAVFLPVAFALRGLWFYRMVTFKFGSAVVILIAAAWMVERVFSVKLLPNTMGPSTLRLSIGIVVAIVMAGIAEKKGFNPLLWMLAGSIPGFIILLCMPSASADSLDEETRLESRKTGNTVGTVISVITILLMAGLIIWQSNRWRILAESASFAKGV